MLLIALFIGLPLLELTLLIDVSERIGWLPTLAVAVITGILGANLARSQGLAIWTRLQGEIAAGRAPTETMMEGLMVFVAGLVLLMPGFLTDCVGLLCLMPVTRRPLLAWLRRKLSAGVSSGRIRVDLGGPGMGGPRMGGPRMGGQGLGGAGLGGPQPSGPRGGVQQGAEPTIKDAEVIDDGAEPG